MSVKILSKNEACVVYKNIAKFCEFRGITMVDYKQLSDSEIISMNKLEVNCTYNGTPLKIIYVPKGSRYSKPVDLNTIIQETTINIVIKGSQIKKIKTSSLKTKVTLLDAKYFLVNFAKFLKVRGYVIKILPNEEVERILNLYKIPNKKCFSAISEHSHEAVWLGAKIDDVVYMEYPTIASCEISSNYKIVSTEVPLIGDDDDEELIE